MLRNAPRWSRRQPCRTGSKAFCSSKKGCVAVRGAYCARNVPIRHCAVRTNIYAEEEARAQQEAVEQPAWRANLAEEQRKLGHLRDRLARDKAAGRTEKGGELANQRLALLADAEQDSSGPLCDELADLAEAIYAFIGWPTKKKKRRARSRLLQSGPRLE